MDLMSGKKVVAVRLEGTLTTVANQLPVYIGEPRPEAVAKIRQMQKDGWYVVIVSGLTKTQHGVSMAYKYIADNAIPYDELFSSYGLPPAERWIDDRAERLNEEKTDAGSPTV